MVETSKELIKLNCYPEFQDPHTYQQVVASIDNKKN